MFWLFLGGLCWVFSDLFQQYAAKYIGIGRGIALSNTNQLWGLAWGALVFGELSAIDTHARLPVLLGSLVMIVEQHSSVRLRLRPRSATRGLMQ